MAPPNPFKFMSRETNKGACLLTLGAGAVAGKLAQTNIVFSGAAVDREVVTVDDGGDQETVYEIVDISTDSTFDVLTDFNNTDARVSATRVGHTFTVGQYLAMNSEIVQVIAVDGDDFIVDRGKAGTTIAAQATGTDPIEEFDGTAVDADAVTVPVLDVTAAEVLPRLEAIISDDHPSWNFVDVDSTALGLIVSKQAGERAVDMTTDIANATIDPQETFGGAPQAVSPQYVEARVPTAKEVAAGTMAFLLPFTPASASVQVITTSTWATVAWDGATDLGAREKGVVLIDNSGGTDWSVNETVYLVAIGDPIEVADADVQA